MPFCSGGVPKSVICRVVADPEDGTRGTPLEISRFCLESAYSRGVAIGVHSLVAALRPIVALAPCLSHDAPLPRCGAREPSRAPHQLDACICLQDPSGGLTPPSGGTPP